MPPPDILRCTQNGGIELLPATLQWPPVQLLAHAWWHGWVLRTFQRCSKPNRAPATHERAFYCRLRHSDTSTTSPHSSCYSQALWHPALVEQRICCPISRRQPISTTPEMSHRQRIDCYICSVHSHWIHPLPESLSNTSLQVTVGKCFSPGALLQKCG